MQVPIKCRQATGRLPDDAALPPLLRQLYQARGINTIEEVDYRLQRLSPDVLLPGAADAAAVLERAYRAQSRILIIGDYDADGTTGIALLMKVLRMLGYRNVSYMVPDRFRFGYGLSVPIVEAAIAEGAPDLLITVDNGITSVAGVRAAKSSGLSVVITDHHLPGAELPPADAIVNPNLRNSKFPAKSLAGVGVALYAMISLRRHLVMQGLTDVTRTCLGDLLDLVAVGTIADVVPLDKDNRILVEQGLRRIRNGKCSIGMRAILQIAGCDPNRVTSTDLAFGAGPLINAAGRLDNTAAGIACLLTEDASEAYSLAMQLRQYNIRRKAVERTMNAEALSVLAELAEKNMQAGICLFNPSWHEGVIGIVAARLKERFYRPTVVFSQSDNGTLKGSARSIAEVHISDLLERIAVAEPNLIVQFGGHAMAAGLVLLQEHFEKFRQRFFEEVGVCLGNQALQPDFISDGELRPEEICYEVAEQICMGAPWGKDFLPPLFDGTFTVIKKKIVADRHLILLLRCRHSSALPVRAIMFNYCGLPGGDIGVRGYYDIDSDCDEVRIAYRLETDRYNGRHSVILNIQYMEMLNNYRGSS